MIQIGKIVIQFCFNNVDITNFINQTAIKINHTKQLGTYYSHEAKTWECLEWIPEVLHNLVRLEVITFYQHLL